MKDIRKLPILLALLLLVFFASFPNLNMEIKVLMITLVLFFNIFILYKVYKRGLISKEKSIMFLALILISVFILGYFYSQLYSIK